jgi:hypothetical protein
VVRVDGGLCGRGVPPDSAQSLRGHREAGAGRLRGRRHGGWLRRARVGARSALAARQQFAQGARVHAGTVERADRLPLQPLGAAGQQPPLAAILLRSAPPRLPACSPQNGESRVKELVPTPRAFRTRDGGLGGLWAPTSSIVRAPPREPRPSASGGKAPEAGPPRLRAPRGRALAPPQPATPR